MSKKITLNFNQSNFQNFLKKMSDLSQISDVIKMKIDEDNIFMYSTISGGSVTLVFKNYVLKTSDVFTDTSKITDNFDIIIVNAKKFVKNLSFIKISEKITYEISYRLNDDVTDVRIMQIKNGKLKLNFQNGETTEIGDMSLDRLSKRINIKNRKWSFRMKSDDFQDIKKLSNINSDGKIISVNVEDGKVKVSESSNWELEVDEIESSQNKLILFNKNYLSSINDVDEIEFNVFDTFLLIKDNRLDYNCNLLISFEQDFED